MRGINHGDDFGWSNAPRFGGGGGTTTSSSQSTTQPWSTQQPYLLQTFQQAANLYDNNSAWPQYFPEQTYASLNPTQTNALGQIANIGANGGTASLQNANSAAASMLSPSYTAATQPAFNQTQGVLSNELSPGYLNPWNSPSFQSVVNNTMASVLPSITSSFIGGNRSNGGLAASAASQGLANAVGNLAQNQYNTNQQIQQNAADLASNNALNQQGNQIKALTVAPLVDQSVINDANAGFQAGSQLQQNQQNLINSDIQRWNYDQTLPFNMLSNYASMIGGNYGGTTNSLQTQPYYSNTGANIATGVGAAASVAASVAAII